MSTYPIFVLNLSDQTSRLAQISEQLERFGLGFERVEAIDGRQGLPDEYLPDIDRVGAETYMKRRLSDGEFACALSHRSMYQLIVDRDLPGAVILEDDAGLSDRFGEFMDSRLYLKAPMILFNYSRVSVTRAHWPKIGGVGRLARIMVNPDHATGYSLSHAVAKKLLKRTQPIRSVADWPCPLFHVRAYAVTPRLVTPHEEFAGVSALEVGRRNSLDEMRAEGAKKKTAKRYLSGEYWRTRISIRLDP